MTSYLIRRILLLIPILLGATLLVFFFIHMIPGDPIEVMLGESASQSQRQALREQYHLDKPLMTQLGYFFVEIATGRLESIFYKRSVANVIAPRLLNTFVLTLAGMFVAIFISFPLGIISALKKDSFLDSVSRIFALVGVSMPNFWLALVLIWFFSLWLRLLPVSGMGGLDHIILPGLTLGIGLSALLSRIIRASLLEVLGSNYLISARARGIKKSKIILKHSLRNALIPVITILGLQFGALLSGAIITETIFAWPGIGRLLVEAIYRRDFPMVQGCVLVIAFSYVFVNLATDLAYAFVDPRVRYRKEK